MARSSEQILPLYSQVILVAIATIIMSLDCQHHTMADDFLETMSRKCFNASFQYIFTPILVFKNT